MFALYTSTGLKSRVKFPIAMNFSHGIYLTSKSPPLGYMLNQRIDLNPMPLVTFRLPVKVRVGVRVGISVRVEVGVSVRVKVRVAIRMKR